MRWREGFVGPGGLRVGWRLAIYLVLANGLVAIPFLIALALGVKQPTSLSPALLLSGELVQFAGGLAAVAIMARIEHRRIAAYGLTLRGAFGGLFWQGALWGIAAVSAVVGLIALCGGYTLGAPALNGEALVKAAAMWALATTAIGLTEELQYRGYMLFTLANGIRFWPAAILISLLFAGEHYYFKRFETWVDAASVGLIGVFFCLMVRRTGNLWFPIGWHAAFNFGQFCLWGGPNSANQGRPFPEHLFASSLHGPEWLTGGRLGIEASAFVFPVMALSMLLFLLLHRRTKWPEFAVTRRAEILELPLDRVTAS